MLFEWIDDVNHLPFPAIRIGGGLILGVLIAWIVRLGVVYGSRKTELDTLTHLRKHSFKAFNIFVPALIIYVSMNQGQVDQGWITTFKVIFILSTSYLLIRSTSTIEGIILSQYDLKKEDNRNERKIVTQMVFIRKAFIVAIVLVTAGILLLSFEGGRKYGAGLLTSAGVASIIIGFAAQKSIANFLAGIQIAFTQPIKLDDAVVVEGEWGWIEEINLTYVVVRIWDWRRLILPITYFIEKPFQNWTRNKGEIIGSVILNLDYQTPIEPLRKKLTEILESEPNWDKKVNALQVVDTKEYTIVVRALMSARNSPSAWDLRCSVREKLISFLQKEHPQSLPVQRILLEK
ncbi:mechanosensitive ion channel family protein [Marinoscillum sp. MHG1-6]|uniref:mechanosensitive ion channel family protein n=1 Tax=Marinoscillum sp. MHG1-6 TaxID=2959627 RepID=UPI0021585F8E|nr:mechanosensitive ion channel family protein [Marinoscillum sp. MHG1-6]